MSETYSERRNRARREAAALKRLREQASTKTGVICPECGQERRNADLLRVHRLIVHPKVTRSSGA